MTSDLTFITNEKDQNLLERFKVIIKDTRFFDVLVGYFYTSGFHSLYKTLEGTEKIRILIGINTDRQTYDLIQKAGNTAQAILKFSHKEAKEELEKSITEEMEGSEDNRNIEEGVHKFIEWLKSKKLEIRAYPSENIHAKVYIMTFTEGDRDKGRVITGSSNFTHSGLVENLEFNVELKNRSDYDFALAKFNELWEDAVDVSEKYIATVNTKTWLNNTITPYELYLKFLYEYFKDELGTPEDIFTTYLPEEFKKLDYQYQAVLNTKKILEEYGGVFISDVVGLGKTYVSAMLAGQLDGRTLVIAPPVLLDKHNPGSWPNVLSDFRVHADYESIGKLDYILDMGVEKYTNIIVDEAHRFRTETNVTYETLAQICRGKRVILVTATPYNNSPYDILSQIKLFQNAKKSTIPNLPNLESFFGRLSKKLKDIDRSKDYSFYIQTVRDNAKEIREKVLKYLMVRRTRTEITKYFPLDISKQGLKFPDVEPPKPLFYELNEEEDKVFSKTIELIARDFKYARYMPLIYYQGKEKIDQLDIQSQKNMGKFMKILLVKRLESSFHAFKNSIKRFIHSYDLFINEFDAGKGNVYVSKKHSAKIFELLENDDDQAVQKLIDEGKAERYEASEFSNNFIDALKNDYQILLEVQKMWSTITRDPKLITFIDKLKTDKILKNNQLIVFTESKETAEYLTGHIDSALKGKVLCYNGSSGESVRDKVIENFDARARHKKDDYRILVSTEVLSEGVNLHRSNVVINYDIPWNPTRMMQRVGRINRVDTKFDIIYTFNFFPTKQSNDQIKLKEVAEAKINAFLTLLGGDAALLTEGEPIDSHELFDRLFSKKSVTGEDEFEESELKYLHLIKTIREKDPDLFNKIKQLPKKARTARHHSELKNSLITYFRLGKLQKFYLASPGSEARELDFMSAAKLLEATPNIVRTTIAKTHYDLLDQNKQAFQFATAEELPELIVKSGKDSAMQIYRIIKVIIKDKRQLTEDQEDYLEKVMTRLQEGAIPKQTAKTTMQNLNKLKENLQNPLKVIATLQTSIPPRILEEHIAANVRARTGFREVILSEFISGC